MFQDLHKIKDSSFVIAFLVIIVRYYDYALFGLSAAVLSKTFMPSGTTDKQLLDFFCVFSVSVLARPIGSIMLGIIGDVYGRTKAVKLSTNLSVFSTTIIAILPNFELIGLWSVALLTISRMLFLISLAGEVDTIRIYIAEKIDNKHKNTLNGIVSFCTQIGALIAAMVYYFVDLNHGPYLWRVSFVIGGISGIIIIRLRHRLQETEEFLKFKESINTKKIKHTLFSITTWNLFICRLKSAQVPGRIMQNFIIAALISGCIGGLYNFCIIFFATFISKVVCVISEDRAKLISVYLIITYAIGSLFAGILADRINTKSLVYTTVITSISVIFATLLIDSKHSFIYLPFLVIVLLPFCAVPVQIKIQTLFDVGIRSSMCSLSHSLGTIVLSSTIPMISMILWERYGSINVVFLCVLVLLCILFSNVLKMFKIQNKLLD